MNKNEIKAILTANNIAFGKKDNLATLTALLPAAPVVDQQPDDNLDPATTLPVATGTGLKIEKDRPEQNGIKRPSAGGRCRAVWDALDQYVTDEGTQPDAKFVRALAVENEWNPNNASIEFYQWRKFHGITGRQPKVAAPEPAAS